MNDETVSLLAGPPVTGTGFLTTPLTTPPILSVCIIARNAIYKMPDGSDRWENCLQSIRARAPGAEIVVLLAGASHDETEAVARKYADIVEKTAGPRGDWDDMVAFDNASWARQRSFELATGRWKMWLDSVTGETPVLVRRRGSAFMEYVEIRDLIMPSHLEQREVCYERAQYEVLTDQGWQPIRTIKQHKVKKPVYRIVDDGDVRVTEDHSLMSGGNALLGRDVTVATRLDHYDAVLPWGVATETLTLSLAEAWGFFAAEGWASEAGDDERGLWAVYNTDRALLERLRGAFEAAHARPFRFVESTKEAPGRQLCWRLEPQDPRDLALFYRERFYSAGGRKKVPREILNGTTEIAAAFVRGYEAGDGHARRETEDGRQLQSWSTNSPLLAAGLVYLYRRLGRDLRCNPPRPDKPGIVSAVERSGAQTRRSVLTRKEMTRISDRYAEGEQVRDIAASLDLDWSSVYRHLRGEIKTYADDPVQASIGKEANRTVRAIVPEPDFEGWVYDLNTEAGTFVGGVGDFILHNSDDRLPGPEEAIELLKANGQFSHADQGMKEIESPSNGTPAGLEEILCFLETEHPKIDVIWCPYLYRRDAGGFAMTWQHRERIVRWNPASPKFTWAEAAHEILVPVQGHVQNRLTMSNLLFVHEKVFSFAEVEYNIRRHYAINLKQYDAGEATTRRALYLAEGCKLVDPSREKEFLDEAERACTTPRDRYRHLLSLGMYYADRGLYWDAITALGAATFLGPDLPDAWLAGAEKWAKIDQWARAIEWLNQGLAIPYNATESYVTPRNMKIFYPALLARSQANLAREAARQGYHDLAFTLFQAATKNWIQVRDSEAANKDKLEIQAYLCRAHNEEESQRHAMELSKLATFLFANDEPLKVEKLLQAVPHTLEDHHLIVEIEEKLAPILRHRDDEKAYFDYYDAAKECGFMATPHAWLKPENTVARARWIAAWVKEKFPTGHVVDYGCSDGIVGIPLLRSCPGVTYTGLDPMRAAIELFFANLFRELPGQKNVSLHVTAKIEDVISLSPRPDAIIWTEVIEHVPDPQVEIASMSHLLEDGGHLLMTTPWGSYDKGHPAPMNFHGGPRGYAGHLRVVSPRQMVEYVEDGGLRVEELHKEDAQLDMTGDQMNVVARRIDMPGTSPVRFFVPGSLWPWNSFESKRDGIGASEEMIIQLGEKLATAHDVEVYGPTPEPDVHHFVKFWPREQIRHVEGGIHVVSRAPSFGSKLDTLVKAQGEKKILWLQDALYPDLSKPEIVAAYDTIVVVSEWHKAAMHELHGVPLDKMVVIYNWYLPEHFEGKGIDRIEDKFVYASSPDRGVIACLEAWPEIKRARPEAELHLFYGWRGCEKLGLGLDAAWTQLYEATRKAYEKLRHQPGVVVRGMIGHEEIAKELLSASVWLHPSINVFGRPFAETCCTLAVKARAAGCIPVCGPHAALTETASDPLTQFVDLNKTADRSVFAQAAIAASRIDEPARREMMERAKPFSIEVALRGWKEVLGR
mgnify:CR=1 FL=1